MSKAELTAAAASKNESPPLQPAVKPPPMSRMSMAGRQRSAAMSKTSRAAAIASVKEFASVAPLPMWNETPGEIHT